MCAPFERTRADEPKLLPESVPEHLVEYVSEVAGGVPLQISEVLEQLTLADNRKVTFIRPEVRYRTRPPLSHRPQPPPRATAAAQADGRGALGLRPGAA
jgi:hypothetical protein